MGAQLSNELEVLEEPQELVVGLPLATPAQPGIFTLEKFVKNEAKYFRDVTEPD